MGAVLGENRVTLQRDREGIREGGSWCSCLALRHTFVVVRGATGTRDTASPSRYIQREDYRQCVLCSPKVCGLFLRVGSFPGDCCWWRRCWLLLWRWRCNGRQKIRRRRRIQWSSCRRITMGTACRSSSIRVRILRTGRRIVYLRTRDDKGCKASGNLSMVLRFLSEKLATG